MKVTSTLAAAAIAFGVAGSLAVPASAEPFQITSSGIWTATVPPQVGDPDTLTGLNTNEIRWGTPDGGGQKSGYRFQGLGPGGAHPTLNVNTLTELLSGQFDVGDFTHINFPITGGSITNAQLKVTINLADTGAGTNQVLNFTFNFTHNETDNFPSPAGTGSCPDTGTTPVPAVGCPDVVGLQTLFSNEVVNIGGVDRVLEIIGFVPGHSGSPVSQFITQENQENLASLLVRFSTPIDEPATLALLGLGLLGLGWQHRRRG